jgi:hypothetical protein
VAEGCAVIGDVEILPASRPLCRNCGQKMQIFTIEPAEEPNHEEYTFYCSRCERQKVIVVKC